MDDLTKEVINRSMVIQYNRALDDMLAALAALRDSVLLRDAHRFRTAIDALRKTYPSDAQGIEARSGETVLAGSTEGESPVANGDAPQGSNPP